ncbi:MAG: ATP-binding protein [Bdellovibrionales bacterium]|nr:ATP-binding protein [Bdellovibrionales bacterium]
MQRCFEGSLRFDLLDPDTENRLAISPGRLKQEILARSPSPEWVVIDEIQKLPKLLDVVHGMIESVPGTKFVLTGSSARKLKRGAANLLAGRAYVYHLHPLTSIELGDGFSLAEALHWGGLPKILSCGSHREKKAYLNSYVATYFSEEIRAEQLVRKLDPFRAFLPVLGQVSGKIINHKRIADEVGTTTATIQSYFQIIEDTLLGFYLPAFHLSVRKSQRQHPKFYLFDTGVKKALEGSLDQAPVPRTSVFGELFEQFLVNEIYRLNSYEEKDFRLSYYATRDGTEIDLILSRGQHHYLVEIKAGDRVVAAEAERLRKLSSGFKNVRGVFHLSNDPGELDVGGVRCLHWRTFLERFKDL